MISPQEHWRGLAGEFLIMCIRIPIWVQAVFLLAVVMHENAISQVTSPAAEKEASGTDAASSSAADRPAPNSSRLLSAAEAAILEAHRWNTRVGKVCAAWVAVDSQRFRLVQDGVVLWESPCSTARNGTGSEMNSNKTPLGWHAIAQKYGDAAPWGAIFRNTQQTKQAWKSGQSTSEDLILTRVMVLEGLEPGKNKGGNIDSYTRGIYIHGTNDEGHIGTPTSHGCIRLTNDDVITAYEKLPQGVPVLITNADRP